MIDVINVFDPTKLTNCLRMISSKDKLVYPKI